MSDDVLAFERPPLAPIEFRTAETLDVRFPDRTIELVAVPYDEECVVEHRGRLIIETIAPGAFDGVERRAEPGEGATVTMTASAASAVRDRPPPWPPPRVGGGAADRPHPARRRDVGAGRRRRARRLGRVRRVPGHDEWYASDRSRSTLHQVLAVAHRHGRRTGLRVGERSSPSVTSTAHAAGGTRRRRTSTPSAWRSSPNDSSLGLVDGDRVACAIIGRQVARRTTSRCRGQGPPAVAGESPYVNQISFTSGRIPHVSIRCDDRPAASRARRAQELHGWPRRGRPVRRAVTSSPRRWSCTTGPADRMTVLEGQMQPLREGARIAVESQRRTAELTEAFAVARNPSLVSGKVEYRSAGALRRRHLPRQQRFRRRPSASRDLPPGGRPSDDGRQPRV